MDMSSIELTPEDCSLMSENGQPGNKATTMGCSESTAVGLYMYLRQSTEGQGMTTSYMY